MNLLNPFNLESHYSIFFSADHIGFDDEKLFIVLDSKNTIFLGLNVNSNLKRTQTNLV